MIGPLAGSFAGKRFAGVAELRPQFLDHHRHAIQVDLDGARTR
jgi:hypothetical protein